MQSHSGIYQIKNLTTGKCYIGSAVIIKRRLAYHRALLDVGCHWNTHLQSAWIKYGSAAFIFVPLLICRKEDLLMFEQRAFDTLSSKMLYNIAPIAGSQLGFRHSSEVKNRLSLLKTGKQLSDRHRAAISSSLMGHAVSEQQRQIFSKTHRGKIVSIETRMKQRIAALARVARTNQNDINEMMAKVRYHRLNKIKTQRREIMPRALFYHRADGFVSIIRDNDAYSDSIENYSIDGGHDFPPLPKGITERIYEPGMRHALVADNRVVDGGPLSWPEGDTVLAMAKSLVRLKQEREDNERARKQEEMAARQ